MRTNIYGLTLEQLEELMVQENQNKYRAKQLFSWIYEKNVTDFDLMSDISKKFIAILKEKYCLIKPTIFTKQVSSDGTIKLLLEMEKINGITIITADHGNAEKMIDEFGNPCTSHTTNQVPFALVGYPCTLKNTGALCDIAPTILEILNIKKPREMTGQSLIKT